MANSADVSDSTDWNQTKLSRLAPVDAALRCQVCKDFYSNAVITSCMHTFCSLCIRRCLAADGKCPACRSSEQEVRLRRNVAVQEVTDAFVVARGQALEVAREHTVPEQEASRGRPSSKRKRSAMDSDEPEQARYMTRGQRKRTTEPSPAVEVEEEVEDDVYVVEESDDGDEQNDEKLVSCPVCNKKMKENAVFSHLDICEVSDSTTGFPFVQPRRESRHSVPDPPLERLPQLNYSLLREAALRKKLAELGIPSWGPKPLMIRRHTEWINLWNANCDASRPHRRRELLTELDTWEKTQGGNIGTSQLQNSVMRKDFDGAGWAKQNKNDFDGLIASARAKPKGVQSLDTDKAAASNKAGKDESERKQPGLQDHISGTTSRSPHWYGKSIAQPHVEDSLRILTKSPSTVKAVLPDEGLRFNGVAAKHELNNTPELAHKNANG